MTNESHWSFPLFSEWLKRVGNHLRECGFQVDLQETPDDPSIRMRVEGNLLLGEIIVEGSSISVQEVASLESGDWLFASYGAIPKDQPYDIAIGPFLSYFLPNQKDNRSESLSS